jgi:hypothetical protein
MQLGCATGEIVSIEVARAHIEAFSQIGKGLLGNLPRKARKASLDLEEFSGGCTGQPVELCASGEYCLFIRSERPASFQLMR